MEAMKLLDLHDAAELRLQMHAYQRMAERYPRVYQRILEQVREEMEAKRQQALQDLGGAVSLPIDEAGALTLLEK